MASSNQNWPQFLSVWHFRRGYGAVFFFLRWISDHLMRLAAFPMREITFRDVLQTSRRSKKGPRVTLGEWSFMEFWHGIFDNVRNCKYRCWIRGWLTMIWCQVGNTMMHTQLVTYLGHHLFTCWCCDRRLSLVVLTSSDYEIDHIYESLRYFAIWTRSNINSPFMIVVWQIWDQLWIQYNAMVTGRQYNDKYGTSGCTGACMNILKKKGWFP